MTKMLPRRITSPSELKTTISAGAVTAFQNELAFVHTGCALAAVLFTGVGRANLKDVGAGCQDKDATGSMLVLWAECRSVISARSEGIGTDGRYMSLLSHRCVMPA